METPLAKTETPPKDEQLEVNRVLVMMAKQQARREKEEEHRLKEKKQKEAWEKALGIGMERPSESGRSSEYGRPSECARFSEAGIRPSKWQRATDANSRQSLRASAVTALHLTVTDSNVKGSKLEDLSKVGQYLTRNHGAEPFVKAKEAQARRALHALSPAASPRPVATTLPASP